MALIAAVSVLAYRLAAEERRERTDRELEAFERAFMRKLWELPSNDKKDGIPPTTQDIRNRFLSIRDASLFPLEMRGLFDPDSAESTYLAFWDGEGQTLFRSANTPETLTIPDYPPPDVSALNRTRSHFRELVRSGPRGFRSLVGRDISADRTAMRRLAWQIAAAGAALWSLGLLGGWWLAGRVIRPINTISQTASRIAEGNLTERIDIAGAEDELSRLSQVLNDTFDRLSTSIERQREFTADASHELRTPLTVILSEISRGLKRERSNEEYREILHNCNHAAGRMRSLVESLMVLARQDGDCRNTPREKTDLTETAAEAMRMLAPLATQHRVSLFSLLEPATCMADPQALAVAAANLLSNAICHQPPGGTATIRVLTKDDHAILEVADTGPGIAPEHLPRLFDRFYRIDSARGSAGGHSGLGLAIVKAIADNHGGRIQVASEPGKGAVFQLMIPTIREDGQAANA